MRLLKTIIKWSLITLVPVLIGVAFLYSTLSKKINKDLVASLLEAKKNIRVDIDDVRPSLFTGKVNLEGVLIGPRDANADNGVLLDQRPKPSPSDTRIIISRISLKINLIDYLFGKLSIRSLIIDGLDLSYYVDANGDHSLDPLLDPPRYINGVINPEYEIKKKRRELAKLKRKLKSDEDDFLRESFNASEFPMPTTLSELVIREGGVRVRLEKSGNNVFFSNIEGDITNFDVDPNNLRDHNSAYLKLSSNLKVTGADARSEYASFDLKASGTIKPFDPSSGFLNPDLVTDITVLEGSKILSLPLATRLASTLEQLEKAGLDVSVIDDELVIGRETTFSLGLKNYVIRAVDALPVIINGNQLIIDQGSWLNTANDEHLINASFTFSEDISNKTFEKSNEYLSEIVGKGVASAVSELIFSPVTKNGNIYIPFVSSGDFNRPKVRPSVVLKDMADAVKEGLKKDPLSILKGILDR